MLITAILSHMARMQNQNKKILIATSYNKQDFLLELSTDSMHGLTRRVKLIQYYGGGPYMDVPWVPWLP